MAVVVRVEQVAKQPPLCAEQVKMVMETVYAKKAPDDREPSEVIATTFKGDGEAYVIWAAGWHGIDLSKIGKGTGSPVR